ncbi:hypothetical protein GCM10012290_11940 [Halolactibacillus alkaliphilus]|uniref:Xanthine/uracil/vitamin C permease n=1 Tax=Halolactibacillus alkaliphilus TaxID=442899 RepID=A0A511X0S6_9BACI|nr:xanthine permease [Halolactibacillus alkaliphilus]GEN56544.1 hypothetical protein HAL01_10080 [Halolactibacillus alkaliphilus]GGN69331.1 hypothetical protein GCM10012290_11940 [Halolactibacillus alkaliphilus]SFO74989.1 putative MFS transporter, AGZA family, xanthine/uracil permease [Halolactibacillus alkaliphilus]
MHELKIKLWQRSDIDGFFGLFTNNLTNLLVMAGLLIGVGFPASLIFGSILPAVGLSIFASSAIYSVMAYRLAKKEQRNTVTALPSGTSVPHMFLIVFLIMGPVYRTTNDPYIAWFAGLSWGFIEGAIELFGSLIGPKLKEVLPRAAMLGSLAGASITFIAMSPAMQTFDLPYIGLVSFAIILLGWFGKVKFPKHIPVGLVAIVIGTAIGWVTGVMDLSTFLEALTNVEIGLPTFSATRIIQGFNEASPFIIAAIPLGIYNMFETIDNIESAEVAGDRYDTMTTMIADGSTSILASLFGSPFPTAVFIGHPGWKEAGARIGYTLATGIAILIISWLGLISLLLTIIPLQAILPILIYIGLIIGAQAFQQVERKYAPAIILALIPWLADWAKNLIGDTLASIGTSAAEIGYHVIEETGLNYSGLVTLGSGAIIIGMVWSTMLVFIIDRQFKKASFVSVLSGILAYFGVIHYETVGLHVGFPMFLSYLAVAALLLFVDVTSKKDVS